MSLSRNQKKPLTPLQKFGLKEIRLMAIVVGKGEPRAMVVAPDKKAYTLTRGVKIGRNKGVVQEITPEEIIVEERFRDFAGTMRTEIKRMTLPQGEGE
ncbi:MAG: pilus assembly protein PilP [Geobacteraceae bacterium]|nr:pilus assembly protein PilP [Geobacteraceae bacterium]